MAAPLAVLISIVIAGVIVIQHRRHVEFRGAIGLMLASLPGIPLGVLLLAHGHEHMVKCILGLLIIAFSLFPHRESDDPSAAGPSRMGARLRFSCQRTRRGVRDEWSSAGRVRRTA
ncbi:MAG TPA: sulfite exporter TauE/SafE family protein [Terriglobales bacterium]|nr:sulfite exporter TauE/SafE family protein [Terriglobales bacterium]